MKDRSALLTHTEVNKIFKETDLYLYEFSLIAFNSKRSFSSLVNQASENHLTLKASRKVLRSFPDEASRVVSKEKLNHINFCFPTHKEMKKVLKLKRIQASKLPNNLKRRLSCLRASASSNCDKEVTLKLFAEYRFFYGDDLLVKFRDTRQALRTFIYFEKIMKES